MFLPYLKDLPSHNSTPPNETLAVAIIAQNLGKISKKLLMKGYDNCSPNIPELFELASILPLHQRLRTARISNLVQNTNSYRENSEKHYATTITPRNNFDKIKYKNLDQTIVVKDKTVGHRICFDFRHTNTHPCDRNYILPAQDHDIPMINSLNHVSLQNDVSGYSQIIPLQSRQLKENFKYVGSSSIFKPRIEKPPDIKNMLLKAMFPVLNFYILIYLDDVII